MTPPVNGSVNAAGNNNVLYFTPMGVIGLLVLASTLLLVGALFVRVTKWRERQKTNLEQSDDYGSIEITKLLLRSRQQIMKKEQLTLHGEKAVKTILRNHQHHTA